MKKVLGRLFLVLFTLFNTISVLAQDISIANISRNKGYYNTKVEISGSGFSTNAASMEVWFGASKGTIESSSENLLIATIPPGATTHSIIVKNNINNLSASSSDIFFPIFQGNAGADITVTDPYNFTNTKELYDVIMVDLDGDGKNDLVGSKKDNTATDIQIYRNTTNGSNISFAETSINVGVPTLRLSFGDIDGDGKQDIIVTRENGSSFYVLRNTSTSGSITFASPVVFFLRSTQFIRGAYVKDMNLDGKPEILISNTSDDELSIFTNTSTPGLINLSFTPYRKNTGGKNTWELIAEDFNYDGKPDVAIVHGDVDVRILPNISSSGTIQFGDPVVIPVNGSINGLEAGDINEDGKIDLALTDFFNNKFVFLPNESTGDQIGFGAAQYNEVDPFSTDLTLADYYGNGKLDVIVSAAGTDNLSIFKNTSTSGTLSLSKSSIPQPYRSIFIVSGDLSDDGKPDLAFTSRDAASTTFNVSVLRNTVCSSPVIITDGDPKICNGQTYTFNTAPLPNTTYIWKQDAVEIKNSADPFVDATVAGSYTVTAVNGACSIESPAVLLTLNTGSIPIDPVASNNGPTCIGGSITLQSTTIAGALSYEWTGPNGYTSTEQNPVITNVTAEIAGTYSVKAIGDPCESGISSTIVEVINPPDLSVSKDIAGTVCDGETITLTVGAAAGYTYQWYKDNTLISGATSNSYASTEAGSYTVNLMGVSNNCDLTSEIVVVETFAKPVPSFNTSGALCEGVAISFTESTVIEPGKTPTFSWDFGDGNTSIEQNPAHTYAAQATPVDYTVTLTIGYEGHTCTGTTMNSISINQPSAFTIDVTGAIPFCEGDSVQLTVPSAGLNSVTWSTGETGFSIYGKTEGTISATAINSAGCESMSDIILTTLPAPNVTAVADKETVSLGESVQLTASGATSYEWTPPEFLDDASSPTPIASPTETTTYTVIGIGDNTCSGSAELTITIEDTGDELPITVPKLFSPNNDGINDFWIIENIQNFPDCELVIFTRSGKLVFETRGYNNDWDGKDANSSDLPEGAYFYTISCSDGKNTSGSVSIIR